MIVENLTILVNLMIWWSGDLSESDDSVISSKSGIFDEFGDCSKYLDLVIIVNLVILVWLCVMSLGIMVNLVILEIMVNLAIVTLVDDQETECGEKAKILQRRICKNIFTFRISTGFFGQ